MKYAVRAVLAALALAMVMSVTSVAQEDVNGTVNTITVNPRQNVELGNYGGTETGQPNDVQPGSENEPNGLTPVTTKMMGSGSNGNMNQSVSGVNPNATRAAAQPPARSKPAESAKASTKPRQ